MIAGTVSPHFSLGTPFIKFPAALALMKHQISGDFSLEKDVSLSEVWIIVVISVPAKRDRHFKGGRRKGYSLEVNEPHSWWFHMLVG